MPQRIGWARNLGPPQEVPILPFGNSKHAPMGQGLQPLGTACFLLPMTRIWKEVVTGPKKMGT